VYLSTKCRNYTAFALQAAGAFDRTQLDNDINSLVSSLTEKVFSMAIKGFEALTMVCG
jgi:hypothetical protein